MYLEWLAKYELREPRVKYSPENKNDYVFIRSGEIEQLKDRRLLIGHFEKKWDVVALNYTTALDALYRFKR